MSMVLNSSVQKTNNFPQGRTPWPPLRIPRKPYEAYSGIYNLLKSKTFINLCFVLLHKVSYVHKCVGVHYVHTCTLCAHMFTHVHYVHRCTCMYTMFTRVHYVHTCTHMYTMFTHVHYVHTWTCMYTMFTYVHYVHTCTHMYSMFTHVHYVQTCTLDVPKQFYWLPGKT